jgi:hypothetical protein
MMDEKEGTPGVWRKRNTATAFDPHDATARDPTEIFYLFDAIHDIHFRVPDEGFRDNIDVPTQWTGS